MPRRRTKLRLDDNPERWLLSYADLVTLLLAFFIVMYSMSRLDAQKFNQMTEAFGDILHGRDAMLIADAAGVPPDAASQRQFGMLALHLKESLRQHSLEEQIETRLDGRGMMIRVLESAAFDPGSAQLKRQMFPILDLIARELKELPNHLRVEGHTDNTPISTVEFPSNWELSTARATGVVRYLVEELNFDPARVSALGFSEYHPVADNATLEGRMRNRRVDIIVLAQSGESPARRPSVSSSPLVRADSLIREQAVTP